MFHKPVANDEVEVRGRERIERQGHFENGRQVFMWWLARPNV